jgi:hypothetical protein
MSILDRMLQQQQFTPSTVEEYLALQLARGLDDESALATYLHYVERHSMVHLLNAFHKAKRTSDPARFFRSTLIPSDQ